MSTIIKILKGAGIVAALFVGTFVLLAFDPQSTIKVGAAMLIFSIVALSGRVPVLRVSRAISVAVLIIGVFALVGAKGTIDLESERTFLALRDTDPAAYLVQLRARDEKKWLAELARLDPKQHSLILLERNRARERKEREEYAEACRNTHTAYEMSKEFVRDRLLSPSTAEFSRRPSSSIVIGDCKFRVVAHVDSQNGFGAQVRTNYAVTLERRPDGKWYLLDFTSNS